MSLDMGASPPTEYRPLVAAAAKIEPWPPCLPSSTPWGPYNPGATVSTTVAAKILLLKFVEMSEVGADDLNPTGRPRLPISDISVWVEKYSTMDAILIQRFPEKGPELLAYQALIVRWKGTTGAHSGSPTTSSRRHSLDGRKTYQDAAYAWMATTPPSHAQRIPKRHPSTSHPPTHHPLLLGRSCSASLSPITGAVPPVEQRALQSLRLSVSLHPHLSGMPGKPPSHTLSQGTPTQQP